MTDRTKVLNAQAAELAAEEAAAQADLDAPPEPETFRTYSKRIDDDPAVVAAAEAEGIAAVDLGVVIRSIPGEELRGLADDMTNPVNDGRKLRDWKQARPNLAGHDTKTARAILRYVAATAPVHFPDRPAPVVEG